MRHRNQEEPKEQTEELTDLELLRGMLEKEKGYLEEMIKVNEVESLPENLIRKKKILVGALAGMLCDLEEPEPEEPEQPPLPLMRNNAPAERVAEGLQILGAVV